jgi:hypothetical protein
MARHNLRGVGGRFQKSPDTVWSEEMDRDYLARCVPVKDRSYWYGRGVEFTPMYYWVQMVSLSILLFVVVGSCY